SSAFAANFRQQDGFANRRERLANSAKIFVGKDCQNERTALVPESLSPCLRENARSRWIMRAVDNGSFVPTLETRRPFDVGKSTNDCGFADVYLGGTQCSDSESRILLLIRPGESDRRFHGRRSDIFDWCFAFSSSRADRFFRFRSLGRGNNRNLSLDDSSFFSRDFSKRLSQPLFVVQIDRGNNRDI